MKDTLTAVLGLALTCCVLYGCYWLAKTVSYAVFYEGMVEQTVRDMVKPDALRK